MKIQLIWFVHTIAKSIFEFELQFEDERGRCKRRAIKEYKKYLSRVRGKWPQAKATWRPDDD